MRLVYTCIGILIGSVGTYICMLSGAVLENMALREAFKIQEDLTKD